jgi:hypothetical protein
MCARTPGEPIDQFTRAFRMRQKMSPVWGSISPGPSRRLAVTVHVTVACSDEVPRPGVPPRAGQDGVLRPARYTSGIFVKRPESLPKGQVSLTVILSARAGRPSSGEAQTERGPCPLRARSGESWRRLTVTRGQTSQDAADQRLGT